MGTATNKGLKFQPKKNGDVLVKYDDMRFFLSAIIELMPQQSTPSIYVKLEVYKRGERPSYSGVMLDTSYDERRQLIEAFDAYHADANSDVVLNTIVGQLNQHFGSKRVSTNALGTIRITTKKNNKIGATITDSGRAFEMCVTGVVKPDTVVRIMTALDFVVNESD